MKASLLVDGPGHWALNVPMEEGETITLGRHRKNKVVLPDLKVSASHAEIIQEQGIWYVCDLKSSNGIFLGGKRVEKAALSHGDLLTLGTTQIVFLLDEAPGSDVWDRTVALVSQHETAIRDAIARAQPDHPVVVPPLRMSPAESNRTEDLEESDPGFEFNPDRYAPSTPSPRAAAMTPDDRLWVAERLADILAKIARFREFDTAKIFREVLADLQKATGAENGFVMIPDDRKKRWVIRSWIGDIESWTQYEREHPVPLTLANRAFEEGRLHHNVPGIPGDGKADSPSALTLNVQFFIAAPLHHKGEKGGLLYMDTRREDTPFEARHCKLIERVGDYLLEIEHQAKS